MEKLLLTGTPRQRGRIHGEALREAIATVLERWQANIEDETGLTGGRYLARFLQATNFLPAVRRWTPDLLDEVAGIAEGACQPFETILALQCMDEDWWFRASLHPRPAHCSAFGFRAPGRAPFLAQNMDIHRMTDGYQVLLHIQSAGLECMLFSFAGFLGLTGLNDRPLAVCCNTLSQLNTRPDGLPVAFVVRGLLQRPDPAAAEAFLRSLPHASGQNYMIAGPGGVVDFECSANGVAALDPGVERLFHTNHPLASRDLRPGERDLSSEEAAQSDSHVRLARLEAALGDGTVEIGAIQAALRTPPVCVERTDADHFYTAGSLIMQLSTPPELQITQGPPSAGEYQSFRFE